MFLEFYGLREQPFGVTPDPRFLYMGESHREALAAVYYGIETRRGFSAIVAEPGMGKTSLLLRLLDSLQTTARTAFLFQTEGNSREFLQALLRDLGITKHGEELTSMYAALNELLLEELNARRRVVVVIDEAQNLSDKTLELVRLLSNFETPEAKLMHIVLAGQPKLEEKLARPGLVQLRQRVAAIAQLRHLRQDETIEYVQHRLRSAGHTGAPIFTTDAYSIIANASLGIPRNINNICFHALSLGFASQSAEVGADLTQEVVNDLGLDNTTSRHAIPAIEPPKSVPVQWPTQPHAASKPLSMTASQPSSAAFPAWPLDPTTAEFPLPTRDHSPRRRVTTAAVFAAIPLLFVFALKYHRDDLNDVADRVADVVSTVRETKPENVLPELTAVKQPASPEISKASPSTATLEGAKPASSGERSESYQGNGNLSHEPLTILTNRRETPADIARDYLGKPDPQFIAKICDLNPSIRNPNQYLPAGMKVLVPNPTATQWPADVQRHHAAEQSDVHFKNRRNGDGATTLIQVKQPATLFQVALDQYGKSNWMIVQKIRILNPQIRDSYQLLSQGEWIRLPQQLTDEEMQVQSESYPSAKVRQR